MRAFKKPLQAAALAAVILLQSVQGIFAAETAESVQKRTFVVTAYYSPLPDQARYLKGSYEADIRLNGNGTHGASGRPVYAGMLAAPKHYAFGTPIRIEGLGVGVVDDRGGAIVKAGERGQSYDRIDVWMGYGDEGLARALAWGRRTVSGTVLPSETANPSIAITGMPKASGKALDRAIETPAPKAVTAADRIYSEPVGPNSAQDMIMALSERLVAVGYLDGKPRGTFDTDVKFWLVRFQTDQGLLKGPTDSNAGYYGPATRKALRAAYAEYVADKKEADLDVEGLLADVSKESKTLLAESEKIRKSVEAMGVPKDGEVGQHVRTLQELLGKLWYLEAKPTGIYGPKTKEAVAKFQIDTGLVSGFSDPNAGKFGKLTKKRFLITVLEGE